MYLEHFGLNEPPFRITPHTDFFFDGANRGATLDALIYAITHDEGIVKVSGEVGSGKTMLCRVLMERLPETVTIVYLANPSLSRDDILYAIADELRLDVAENSRTSVVMRALQDHLIKSYGEGRQVVVLIDEAHAMPSGYAGGNPPAVEPGIQPQQAAATRALRPTRVERHPGPSRTCASSRSALPTISAWNRWFATTSPITWTSACGRPATAVPAYSPKPALKLIAQSSLGLTRRINIIADKSLLAAFSASTHSIGAKEARAAIRDCDFSDATYRSRRDGVKRLLWLGSALAVTLIAALAMLAFPAGDRTPASIASPPMAAATTERAPQAAAASAPATPLAATPTSTPPDTAAPKVPPPPTSDTSLPLNPAQNASAVAGPAPALAGGGSAVDPNKQSPVGSPAMPQAQVTQGKSKIGRLTRDRIESSKAWLDQLPNDRWFIQIFATDATRHAEVESLLRKLPVAGDEAEHVRVYYSELSGTPRYGVIYGDFASREAASTAIRSLPKHLRGSKPYPRQAIRLR
jgi:MSHA biogenesis protein MshM